MDASEHAEDLPNYGDWSPTGMDHKGLNLPDRQAWKVGPSRTRDSEIITESNFKAALASLGGESETVEVHSFGHWACGWFEIIIVDPSDDAAMTALGEVVCALENYPILDEHDVSERESEAACEAWEYTDLKERIELCERGGVSIFAARRESPPWDDDGSIQEALLGY